MKQVLGRGRTVLVENVSRKDRLELLPDLQNQYAASEPVRYILDKLEIPDHELAKDLLIDSSDLIFDLDPLECVSGTYYPNEEANICSILINLGPASVGATVGTLTDPFLESLTPAMTRGKKWMNLISNNDSNKPLIFTDESDYWRVVRAVRNAASGKEAVYSCRCQWKKKEPPSKGKPAIDEIIDISCEVRSSTLRLVTGARQGEVVNVDLKELKGISLSYNFVPMQKYLVDLKFASAEWTTKQTLEMTSIINYGSESRNYRTKLGGTVTVALTEELIKNGSVAFAIRNGQSKSSDAAIVGEHIFQFEQLMTSGGNGVPPLPKFDQTIKSTLPLQTSTGKRMAKLTIYRATDLFCTNPRNPPSPYCQAFMLGANKLRIGKSTKDMQTIQIRKSQNPNWNTEIELHGPQGIEGVEYVLVLIKDGSGMFEHKHLGQVVIPISTFLFGQNELEVTLKIEPTEKMRIAKGQSLGNLIIHAEVAAIMNSKPKATMLRGKNSNVQIGSAELNITARLTNEYCTWWPITPLSDPTDETGRITFSTGITANGHVVFGFDRMVIRLIGNVNISIFKEVLKGAPNTLYIPWNQVKSVDALTDSVAIVTVVLSKSTEAATKPGAKPTANSVRGSGPLANQMHWEILVCPCPAAKLASLWRERKALCEARVQLKNFLKGSFAGALLSASQALPSARAVMESIEQHLITIAGDPPTVSSEARVHVYLAQLLQACRRLDGGPVYDKAVVRKLVKTDCESDKTVATTGTGGEISSAKVVKKMEFIIDFAIARLRDYVLCCWEPFTSTTQSGIGCLEEMVNCYLSEIRTLLGGFVGSKKALLLLKGHENRTQMVTYLIREELKFDLILRKILGPIRLLCRPQARLLESENMDAVLIWYNACLLDEVKVWLRRLLDQAKMAKTNIHGLPWDYENRDGKFMSSYPEQIFNQVSSYLELRVFPPAPGAWEEEKERARKINDRILRALGQALVLLIEEYKKALQSRNWSESNGTDNMSDICFIVSIVNDCYRLGTTQTEPFRSTAMISPSSDDVAFTLINEFNNTAETALKFLLKIIFAESKPKFNDFDKLWASQTDTNPLIGGIVVSITNKITPMRPLLETHYYGKLLSGVVDVCVSKYLQFLRTKSESGASAKLNKIQSKRIQTEVTQYVQCFRQLNSSDDFLQVNFKIQYLEEIRDLLLLDYSSPQYLELVHRIARKYCVDGRAAIIRMFAATVTLRTDGSFRVQQAIDAIVDKFKSTASPGEVDMLDDIYIRVFGNDADNKGKGGFFFFGGGKKSDGTESHSNKTSGGENNTAALNLIGGDEDTIDFDKFDENGSETASTTYGDAESEYGGGDSYPVEVSDIRVRGLRTRALLSNANPYVKVVLNAQRFKTNVLWNSNSGMWSDYSMNFHVATSNLQAKSILVIVYDKERVRRKSLLGTVKIPLAGIDRGPIQGWFTLERVANPNEAPFGTPTHTSSPLPDNASCGQIHMRVSLANFK